MKNISNKTKYGIFTINDSCRYFDVNKFSVSDFVSLKNSEVFEENGLKGCRKDGEILLYPIFDFIEYVPSTGRIFLVYGTRYAFLEKNGGYSLNCDYDHNNHFIFKNGKMGWEKDGRVIVEPKYDEVRPWGFGLYEVKETQEHINGFRTLYYNEKGEEKLTFRRSVISVESPFELRTNKGCVLTVLECAPSKSLSESNIIDYDGLAIGIDRFNALTLENELINEEDILPLYRKDIEKLSNPYSYEFSAYRFTVRGEKPLDEIIKLIEKFNVNDNTWLYVMRFTTAVGEHISTAQINRFTKYLDNMDNHTLGRAFAFGTDNKLQSGEVSVLLITHYYECCFPPQIQYEFVEVFGKGTLDELTSKDKELKSFANEYIIKGHQKDFLQDTYDTAFENFGYNPERSWEDTIMVLDFLSSKSDAFMGNLIPLCKQIISRNRQLLSNHEKEYFLGYLNWLSKRDNVNSIIGGRTALDLIDHAMHNGEQADVELLRKVWKILIAEGARNYSDFKQEYIATQGDYAFSLYLLRQQTHTMRKTLTILD